ncbi:hypothetical protein FZEAL_1675 [Fusarium zealandicum]|uniref:Uncharacterized protein n=1 Tax=Fusarium zealandicum TaxID=1053134 RepID=A0A8H4USL6_9HYPO|nr:hypothetical protein FZEAL_1675 [Fusarium zealandicum]
MHLQKGLNLLRTRLSAKDEDSKISNSTIGVVLKLASAAHFNGDLCAAREHMEGLVKMVRLRGGLGVFKGKQLLVDMLRCDLNIALLSGIEHVFFRQPSEPIVQYPDTLLTGQDDAMIPSPLLPIFQTLNPDLGTAWRAMKRFCSPVNRGTQTQRLMSPSLIYETMAAVTYRLVQMQFDIESINEAMRYGLLVYSHHIFLQWQDIQLPYHHFSADYRQCILSYKDSNKVSSRLMLWLLMSGAVSLYTTKDEDWPRDLLQEYISKREV